MAAVLAALVIIPAMATTGSKLSAGGPGLMFIHLPNLFKGMPGGRILMVVFFVAVLFAGVSSLINLFEAPIATLQEKLGFARTKEGLSIAAIGSLIGLWIQLHHCPYNSRDELKWMIKNYYFAQKKNILKRIKGFVRIHLV